MFGFFRKSKASTPTNESKEKQPNTKGNDWEPGSDFVPAQASLIDSFKETFEKIENDVLQWDPRSMSDEEIVETVRELMRFISTRIDTKGEMSYIAKKTALFMSEMLLSALRRDCKPGDIPPVHATLMDDMYSCIDATRTGLYDNPDVEAIDQEYKRDVKQILRQVQRKAGISIVLPT